MDSATRKTLVKAQQNELDAVMLYKALAKASNNEQAQEKFKAIAADESRHAGILRAYTQEQLHPKKTKARLVVAIHKVMGPATAYKLLINGEMDSLPFYEGLLKEFPEVQKIMDDELKHAKIVEGLKDAL